MKKVLLIFLIIVFSALNLCYSQNNQIDVNYDEVENDDNIEYIYDSIEMKQVQRFGFGLPDIGTTRSRVSTDEEFIFKTYIMDKLLKSNRILY
jgi:hypothetical protein